MKMFILTLFLFLLMLFLIVTNAIYINRMTSELDERVERLSPFGSARCEAEVVDLQKHWQKQVDLASLSASFLVVDHVSEQIATMLACTRCGDLYGYQTALALLTDAIDDLRRMEGIG